MIPEISILTVIGLALGLALFIAKWWYENNSSNAKVKEDEDKKIDASNDADSLLRRFDELSK
jgi:hypothetical protein